MVEFVILITLLLLLVFGITELGRGLYQSNTLTKAVESGVRYMTRAYDAVVLDRTAGTCSKGTGWAGAVTKAKNIVVYGTESGVGSPKVAGLTTAHVSVADPRHVMVPSAGGTIHACVIRITVDGVPYDSPLLRLLKIGDITFSAVHEERYIGE